MVWAGAGEPLHLGSDKETYKPMMAARVFRALLEEKIDVQRMQRLNHAIDLLDVSLLPQLRDFYDGKMFQETDGRKWKLVESQDDKDGGLYHLATCGLVYAQFGRGGAVGGLRGGFGKNDLGRLFLEIVCQWAPPADTQPKETHGS